MPKALSTGWPIGTATGALTLAVHGIQSRTAPPAGFKFGWLRTIALRRPHQPPLEPKPIPVPHNPNTTCQSRAGACPLLAVASSSALSVSARPAATRASLPTEQQPCRPRSAAPPSPRPRAPRSRRARLVSLNRNQFESNSLAFELTWPNPPHDRASGDRALHQGHQHRPHPRGRHGAESQLGPPGVRERTHG